MVRKEIPQIGFLQKKGGRGMVSRVFSQIFSFFSKNFYFVFDVIN